MLALILLVLALVLFVVASFWTPPRVNLIALGLAALTASMLAGGAKLP